MSRPSSRAAVTALLLAVACSRPRSMAVSSSSPWLYVYCQPGDRVQVIEPFTSDERPCRGEKILGGEQFALDPGQLRLGHNHFLAKVTPANGAPVSLTFDYDWAPPLEKLFTLEPPLSGPNAVSSPPVVAAPFLPGKPSTSAAIRDATLELVFTGPAKTRLDVAGKTYTVEPRVPTEIRVDLGDALAGRAIGDACAAIELPARVTRTDGVVHEGKLLVSRAAPRLLRRVTRGRLPFAGGEVRRGSMLLVRDDDFCAAVGDATVGGVALLVLVDQERRDLPGCSYGAGRAGVEQARVVYDARAAAYDPRSGKKRGEKRFPATAPQCDSSMRVRLSGGRVTSTLGPAAVGGHVGFDVIEKWASALE